MIAEAASTRSQHKALAEGVATLLRQWSWMFLLVLLIVFSITGQGFFDVFNFQSILLNASILALLALGQTFVIMTGGIDLSAGFVAGVSSVLAALAMNALGADTSAVLLVLVGVGVAIGVGVVAGVTNGAIVEGLRIPPFIATLGIYGVAQGIGLLLSHGQPVSLDTNALNQVGNGYVAYLHDGSLSFFSTPDGLSQRELRDVTGIVPNMVVLVGALFVAGWWILAKTRFGRHVYAVGGNRNAARRAGVAVRRTSMMTFVLCSVLAGIAGLVYVLRFTSGSAITGDATLLQSIAAVVIGGTSMFGGAGNVGGTLVGVLIIAVIQNGLVILGVNPYWQFIAVGLVIVLAVVVDRARTELS
ncbi:ABC transporter permease [Conexibacter sp. CPCC 206217]|uniref:ABC transporter permease n=1 Tax=Conexibacter sp. CPCC 206217 TaxID=3064574 RepID=UPI00271CBBB6|nr:ABC transporter permease [Conexibacter sp. CPCC 206217]MDO8209626.1 ABC transporter permease [Conexibacter sp. CPCC 206217]